jgi:hypothetical protein
METRKKEINNLLDSITINEIDDYIKDRHIINDDYKKMIERIKINRPDTHFQKIVNNIHDPVSKGLEYMYKFGMAIMMSRILFYYSNKYKISDLQDEIKNTISNDKILKEYVYDYMKDLK